MSVQINGTNGLTFNDGSSQQTAASGFGFKNRIINGAMMIDQRNAGASVSATDAAYTLDRWKTYASQTSKFTVQQNAGSVTPPAGFVKYLGVTSSSAYSVGASERFAIAQDIEGLNLADFAWGTSSASAITISFWVRSSLTGTFGGSLLNSGYTRSYPFTYTILSANTWEQKTVTVAGDTTGTWLTTNDVGLRVWFGLGVGSSVSGTAGTWSSTAYVGATGATSVVGTNGATFYITGVQLEKGSTATSFDYRPYGTELALCQRYYYKMTVGSGSEAFGSGFNETTTAARCAINFPVTMRSAPTAIEQTGTASDYRVLNLNTTTVCSSAPTFVTTGTQTAGVRFTVASGLTAGQGSICGSATTSAYLGWSAEL